MYSIVPLLIASGTRPTSRVIVVLLIVEPGVYQRLFFTGNGLEFGVTVGCLFLSGWIRLLCGVLSVLAGLDLLHQVVLLSSAFNLLPLVSLDIVFF